MIAFALVLSIVSAYPSAGKYNKFISEYLVIVLQINDNCLKIWHLFAFWNLRKSYLTSPEIQDL